MEIKLQKWGNSTGIRIPNPILKSLNLKTSDIIDLKVENEKIIITKSLKNKISLKERFENYHGKNLAKDFSWDDSVGNKIW